ncbi:MAG: hypothetical protein LBS91_06030 [Clostridiales Family XIII bacterium]|jgi:hypothetical protein|nr:hypothetical protein [Clostridiales Family XIII bacterium]
MATKIEPTNNHMHSCNGETVVLREFTGSLSDSSLTKAEIILIVNFYLFHAPVISNSLGTQDKFGHMRLRDYGWADARHMNQLERLLLAGSSIPSFIMLKSESIKGTLSSMLLDDIVCIEHPRAVMKINSDVKISEANEVKVSTKETRMECLFRHIRNSLAHNCIYVFANGNILLEDSDEKENLSARILIQPKSLIDWIEIIKKDGTEK